MNLRLLLLVSWFITLLLADEKELLDLSKLSPLCYEPDPFNIDECFESCDPSERKWAVSLDEVDFDRDLHATVFTYTVNVWESGVCSESVISNNKYKTNNMDANDMKKENEPKTGIEALYIMFNGCCNDSAPVDSTKAITPQIRFDFLKAGWYWKTMVMPGYQNLFGFMIYGNVELTKGTYCVRTGYHCVCEQIAVPDLCKNKWDYKKDHHWDGMESSDQQQSIDHKPIWA
eukprot:312338_1